MNRESRSTTPFDATRTPRVSARSRSMPPPPPPLSGRRHSVAPLPGPLPRARRSFLRILAALAAPLLIPDTALAQTWTGIVPNDLSPGAQYRILFVTSGTRNQNSRNINDYNTFVQTEADAATGDPFDGITFKVLGSTASRNARTNTGTDPTPAGDTGVPIYYYRGEKVADHYDDLYDGSWDSLEPRDRNGDTIVGSPRTFTGTDPDGTVGSIGTRQRPLGASSSITGQPKIRGRELNNRFSSSSPPSRFYALSEVLGSALDVDGNGTVGLLTDGLLLVRYLIGTRGPALTNLALASDAHEDRDTHQEIAAYLQGLEDGDVLDVDGNGTVGLLTDGLLIVRYLIGTRGSALTNLALAADAHENRDTHQEITAYLDSLVPPQ